MKINRLALIVLAASVGIMNAVDFKEEGYALASAWNLSEHIFDVHDGAVNYLGGLRFHKVGDASTLCIVEDSEDSSAAIHCLDVIRDEVTGTVVDVGSTNSRLDIFDRDGLRWEGVPEWEGMYDYMQVGFSTGPEGFDFISFYPGTDHGIFDDNYPAIAQATWEYDGDGRPLLLNVTHVMEVYEEVYLHDYDVYGIEFSNIAKDPCDPTGQRHLMFAVSIQLYCKHFHRPRQNKNKSRGAALCAGNLFSFPFSFFHQMLCTLSLSVDR